MTGTSRMLGLDRARRASYHREGPAGCPVV